MLHNIKITNLFGLYSYEFNSLFTEGFPIRFITGPNGYGKSTILSILSHLLLCDFAYFKALPFDELQFCFDDRSILIHKLDSSLPRQGEDISKSRVNSDRDVRFSLIDLINMSEEAFYQISMDESDSGKAEIEMFINGLSHYYIKDQRLFKSDTWSPIGEALLPTAKSVNHNAQSLQKEMQQYKLMVNSILSIQNLSLDHEPVAAEVYEERKAILNPYLNKLKLYGLSEWGFDLPKYQPMADNLMGAFLFMAENAVECAEPLLRKIDLFKEIIEGCEFADKEFQISSEYGYRFVSLNNDKTLLDGSDLSSGEQHILIQSYELIFNAHNGALALIDEPEMSFHMIWQMNYLKNLRKIANLNNLQCIVATHSPQIFDSMWDLTYDLYEITHPRTEE